jgi:hypothetical protein
VRSRDRTNTQSDIAIESAAMSFGASRALFGKSLARAAGTKLARPAN